MLSIEAFHMIATLVWVVLVTLREPGAVGAVVSQALVAIVIVAWPDRLPAAS
jgi:hypothetical protein